MPMFKFFFIKVWGSLQPVCEASPTTLKLYRILVNGDKNKAEMTGTLAEKSNERRDHERNN